MPEPVTLAVLGTAALMQGINFLYGQATELLKRRRDRRDAASDAAVLDGELAADVDEEVVEQRSEQLRMLTEQLQPFVTGARRVGEPPDAELIARVEALRGILELAYRQRITFDGEDREPTGASIDAKVIAGRVDGELAVVDVDQLQPGTRVKASGTVGDVGPGGKVTGFRGNVARGNG
jgi:hypothetical protein